jgi:hypothetical protein
LFVPVVAVGESRASSSISWIASGEGHEDEALALGVIQGGTWAGRLPRRETPQPRRHVITSFGSGAARAGEGGVVEAAGSSPHPSGCLLGRGDHHGRVPKRSMEPRPRSPVCLRNGPTPMLRVNRPQWMNIPTYHAVRRNRSSSSRDGDQSPQDLVLPCRRCRRRRIFLRQQRPTPPTTPAPNASASRAAAPVARNSDGRTG